MWTKSQNVFNPSNDRFARFCRFLESKQLFHHFTFIDHVLYKHYAMLVYEHKTMHVCQTFHWNNSNYSSMEWIPREMKTLSNAYKNHHSTRIVCSHQIYQQWPTSHPSMVSKFPFYLHLLFLVRAESREWGVDYTRNFE